MGCLKALNDNKFVLNEHDWPPITAVSCSKNALDLTSIVYFSAIERACQTMKDQETVGLLRKFVKFWNGLKDAVDELFGQSEEDLIFRKLTGIDELFVKGKILSKLWYTELTVLSFRLW